MRAIHACVLAALLSTAAFAGAAHAEDQASQYVSPPPFREMARDTRATRTQVELKTTPQPVWGKADAVEAVPTTVASASAE